eukprot:SAG22_NODE_3935_length_1462_cov_2.920763_1_plen_113_part_10
MMIVHVALDQSLAAGPPSHVSSGCTTACRSWHCRRWTMRAGVAVPSIFWPYIPAGTCSSPGGTSGYCTLDVYRGTHTRARGRAGGGGGGGARGGGGGGPPGGGPPPPLSVAVV